MKHLSIILTATFLLSSISNGQTPVGDETSENFATTNLIKTLKKSGTWQDGDNFFTTRISDINNCSFQYEFSGRIFTRRSGQVDDIGSFRERTDINSATDRSLYQTITSKVLVDLSNLDPNELLVSKGTNENINKIVVKFKDPETLSSTALPKGISSDAKRVDAIFSVRSNSSDSVSNSLLTAIRSCSIEK